MLKKIRENSLKLKGSIDNMSQILDDSNDKENIINSVSAFVKWCLHSGMSKDNNLISDLKGYVWGEVYNKNVTVKAQ